MNLGLFRRWWADEPARFWAALAVFVNAFIAFAVAMEWLVMSGLQVALLYVVVIGGLTLVGGEDVRRRVSPVDKEPAPEEPGDGPPAP